MALGGRVNGHNEVVKTSKKVCLTSKQKLILEYAYGRDNPNFDRPPMRSTYEIAGLVGVSHAYVSVILNGSYKINDLKDMYHVQKEREQCGDEESLAQQEKEMRSKDSRKQKKFMLSDKQEQILELAYGKDDPDFSKPPKMSQFMIAKEVGVTESYVSALLRNNYKFSSDALKQMYLDKKNGRIKEKQKKSKLKKILTEQQELILELAYGKNNCKRDGPLLMSRG